MTFKIVTRIIINSAGARQQFILINSFELVKFV